MTLASQTKISDLKQSQQTNIEMITAQKEKELVDLAGSYEKRLAQLRFDLTLRKKVELREIEERKNKHISQLLEKHQEAFTETKKYYNEITQSNLKLIRSLKKEIEEHDKRHSLLAHQMALTNQANKDLRQPREEAEEKVESLRLKLANYEKDRSSLQTTRARLATLQAQVKKLSADHEELENRFLQTQTERDSLSERFENVLSSVRDRASATCEVLNRRIEQAHQELSGKETQLNEVLRASALDPNALRVVTQKLDAVLDAKNKAIRDLQYEVHRVTKAHNDAVRVYEAKLLEFGIPEEELGYDPVLTQTTTAPAGLVSALL